MEDGRPAEGVDDGERRLDVRRVLRMLAERLPAEATPAQLAEALAGAMADAGPAAAATDELPLRSPVFTRAILDNLHDAVLVTTMAGAIRFFSASAERIFGHRREEMRGVDIAVLMPQAGEAMGRRKDGSTFPAEATVARVNDHLVWTIKDITDRKRIEDELVRHNRVLQAILDNIPCGISVFGADLSMQVCNEQFKRLLDFPDDLFADGLPHFERLIRFNVGRGEYGPGDPEALSRTVLERARKPVPHVIERVRPDGTVLEIRGQPLPGGGFVTIYIDITERKRVEEEARRYATYLRNVLDNLPQGVSVFDETLSLVLWNQPFVRLLDLPEALVHPGVSFETLIRYNAARGEYGPGEVEDYVEGRVGAALDFRPHRLERARPDGTILEVQGQPMCMAAKVVGFVTTYSDITQRRKAEAAVRRANQLMEEAISYSPTFIWEIDPDGRFTFIEGCRKVLGYTADEVIGRNIQDFLDEEDDSPIRAAVAARTPYEHLMSRMRAKGGAQVWISVSAHPIFESEGGYTGYRGVAVDVTELRRAREELERMALEDSLTGLANRRRFLDRFRLECERRRRHDLPMSLLVVDIDHFKSVNDRFGHLVGDVCLRRVAEVLSDNVREIDLVARFGGEEFVVLLPETPLAGAVVLAEKLRMAVAAAALPVPGQEGLRVTVSIGVATAGNDEPDFDGLMEIADRHVYAAKHHGRNRVCTGE